MAAAATARPGSGGRNVASVSSGPIEETSFSSQIGVSDNRLLRYDEEYGFDFGEHPEQQPQGRPFVMPQAATFRAETVEENRPVDTPRAFLSMLMRGISTYESNMRIITPGAVRPGSVMNHLY